MIRTLPIALVLLCVACGGGGDDPGPPPPPAIPDDVEATSFLGQPLKAPPLPGDVREERERQLAEAREALAADAGSVDALIWFGRRTAYLGRYREAVAIYTRGIGSMAPDPRLYRHRGHRYVSLRRLDDAIADLEHATGLIKGQPDLVEPDGLPNAQNIPTSTLQSNIWYHLGLAYYLGGDFDNALRAYRECMKVSNNPDMLSATSHWLYTTLRRLGRDLEAEKVLEPIHADMDIIENKAYHRLLLMYKGEIEPDALLAEISGDESSISFASAAYGVGNWYRQNGESDRAAEIFERIVAGGQWPAFGFIAAEAELARKTQ